MATKKAISAILDRLENLWGQEKDPGVSSFDDPLDGLILTILSQNTNDNNRDRAFKELKSRYARWKDVAALEDRELADAIRVAGIANVKSRRILDLLAMVKENFGEYSLKEMSSWDGKRTEDFLNGIPGVGPKTAACVMVFDLGIPAFPVDTHVARFCRRMAWVPESMTPVKIQEYMETMVPPKRKKGAHLNIICHCKVLCKARSPECGKCPIRDECPSCLKG